MQACSDGVPLSEARPPPTGTGKAAPNTMLAVDHTMSRKSIPYCGIPSFREGKSLKSGREEITLPVARQNAVRTGTIDEFPSDLGLIRSRGQ
jgi:hypothetical protein